MATVVRMPSVLAGATEAAIAHWLVGPGDTVTAGTPIAEIETEKALVEYAAEEAGVVGRLVLREGDSGEIGDPIAVLVAAGETDADIDAALGGVRQAPAPDAGAPLANGHQASAASAPAASARIFASPLVRKLAGEQGIDLARLEGTGPNGRIVRRDLERFLLSAPPAAVSPVSAAAAAGPAAATPPSVTARGTGEPAPVMEDALTAARPEGGGTASAGAGLIPHTPMRRAIARRLTESKATVPHFYLAAEPVVDELLALRGRVNEALAHSAQPAGAQPAGAQPAGAQPAGAEPVKVSVNDFVVAAAAAAFGDVPEANVTWSDDGLVTYRSVDISIAVATDGGLVTPVLRAVEGKKLSAIARESAALARRARDRKLRQHELEGGTFTVSNLGMYGTVEFSAIINPPQSGILAVGAARPQPVVADGAVVAATVMRCTLSVDHRAIDGALAARWLAAFTTRLENPLSLLV